MKKLAITLVVVIMAAGINGLWAQDPEGIYGESLIERILEPLDSVRVTLWYGEEETFEGNTEDSPDGNQYRAYYGANGSKWLIHIPYGHSYYVTGYKYDPEWPWYSEHYGPLDYEGPNDSHEQDLIMWQE